MSQKYEFSFPVKGDNFDDAGKASIQIKKRLKGLGITGDVLRRTAIAIYESEVNIISYARQGNINIRVTDDNISINIRDSGPGIADIKQAMQQGYSTANDRIRKMGFGAGMGLFNIKNCSDDFEILSKANKGTLLKILINR
ncbi:MAG: ATP-binding protein [Deltaproteobacteria bacterium]|nr:ATP-binding protein [Deltaproteobacteria bacterium]